MRDQYDVIGTNARLDTLQAAVLLVKLKSYAGDVLPRRQAVATWYDAALEGLEKEGKLVRPSILAGNTHTYAQYTVKFPSTAARTVVMNKLKEEGIPNGIYYATPLHMQKCFADLGHKAGDFPVSEDLCATVLSLPIHQYVTKEQVLAVCAAVKAVL